MNGIGSDILKHFVVLLFINIFFYKTLRLFHAFCECMCILEHYSFLEQPFLYVFVAV